MCGLCSLKTNSCCCGISLRTGTIAILVLGLIGSVSVTLNHKQFENYGTSVSIGEVILICIEIAALYGVYKKKPDFIIPHLVITAIQLIICALIIVALLIGLPFASKLLNNITYRTADGRTEHLSKDATDMVYAIYVSFTVIVIIYEAVKFHFFKVVLCHYRELKTVFLNVNPPPPIGFNA